MDSSSSLPTPPSEPSASSRYEEFLLLYSRHQSRLFRYILVLVPNWNDAEEVFQETSLVLWRAFDQFTPGTDFFRWAARVSLNQVLSFRRRQKRWPHAFDGPLIESLAAETIAQTDLLEARREALATCLRKLKPRDFELIQHSYVHAGSIKELSELLSRPADTVYKALRRIRGVLFDCVNRTLVAQARLP